jgi:hypothetical protein
MRIHKLALLFVLLAGALIQDAFLRIEPVGAGQATIPSPKEFLGFTPGDDRKLASWDEVVEYFQRLDQSSDRLNFEELGRSTMGKPFVVATISSPENLARLNEFKEIQDQLADPRKLGAPAGRDKKAAELIARGKTIVLITCGIHSTEVGSYLSSMLIAHRLASSNEPEIQKILNNTIVLLVPSLNPDGVDIVKTWYDKTLGTPYEGTDPPELYHKYTGHDNNRDWYAFTQVETQLTVDKIHNVWHPQIVHDIHQQGAFGSRLFLPPYMPPVEPNVPKQIVEGYTELGSHLAREMRGLGFKGITTNSTYDAWSPSRAYSHYHGGVRILSETASARIASPITVKFEDLNAREGYDPKKESANFGPLWQGGDWKLRDITNTMTTCAFLLLKHAAENREHWLQKFYSIGRDAVRPRRPRELFGYVIPPSAHRSELMEILLRANVEVGSILSAKLGNKPAPANSKLVRVDQPNGAFAKALFERTLYPDRRDSTGHPIAPYDVTAHNLPLLMGIEVHAVAAPFKFSRPPGPLEEILGATEAVGSAPFQPLDAIFRASVPSMDEGWTRYMWDKKELRYGQLREIDVKSGRLTYSLHPGVSQTYRSIIIPDQPARTILNGYRSGLMPKELTDGLGDQGVNALRQFVEAGGVLVCLNRASDFAIEQFRLPIRNVVAGLPRTQFYVPGSILRLELDLTHPLANGMPKESIAWVEDSPVFEIVHEAGYAVPPENVRIIGSYPLRKDPLLSGWLLGGERIKGKAALVEVTVGKGRIILFGFRPQYRAQSLATYPLFFNSLKAS